MKKKLKLYLDSSCLNRVFDDQTQPRIYLESAAMTVIFNYIDNKIFTLVSSEVLIIESEKNPYEEIKAFVDSVLKKAKNFQQVDKIIVKRAKEIEKFGIKGMDALHVACAESQKSDYFLTCDDRIIKKYEDNLIDVKNPIDFYMEYEEK